MNEEELALKWAEKIHKSWANAGSYSKFWSEDVPKMLRQFALEHRRLEDHTPTRNRGSR